MFMIVLNSFETIFVLQIFQRCSKFQSESQKSIKETENLFEHFSFAFF